jgi:SAM-dependent methyltransferase
LDPGFISVLCTRCLLIIAMTRHSSTSRFSNRVEDYIRYRPHYPPALLEYITSHLGLKETGVVADIGSGTGISSEMFLRNGNKVWAIEPNTEMREAAERLLSHYPGFQSVAGTAENIPLGDHSVDMIVSAQAFHWFVAEESSREFRRVLKPGSWTVLLWNDRDTEVDGFARGYEALLKTLLDYNIVNHKNVDESVFDKFFGSGNYSTAHFENFQEFDFEGLKGRLMSSSYAPVAGHPAHEPMIKELERLFELYNINGKVRILYDTKMVYGKL